jgi:hypothetical protein
MRWCFPLALLLLSLPGCSAPGSGGIADRFACRPDLVTAATSRIGNAQPVPARRLDAVFRRLDRQRGVEVRQVSCGRSVELLRYSRPRRMQFVAWLNRGTPQKPSALRDPRETEIGNRMGYTGHWWHTPWTGMGVTAERMLLPATWEGMGNDTPVLTTFYLISPPTPGVLDRTIRVRRRGTGLVYVEQWRGLWFWCPPGVSCPAPDTDPGHFARFTAVLDIDSHSGLPVSLLTVARVPRRSHGRVSWTQPLPVSQVMFTYGGTIDVPRTS